MHRPHAHVHDEQVVGAQQDAHLGQVQGVDVVVVPPEGVDDLHVAQVLGEGQQEVLLAAVNEGDALSERGMGWFTNQAWLTHSKSRLARVRLVR